MGCEDQGCTIQWETHQIAKCVLITTVKLLKSSKADLRSHAIPDQKGHWIWEKSEKCGQFHKI